MAIPDHAKPPLPVGLSGAKNHLTSVGITATDAEIEAALSEIDQVARFDAERASLTVTIWDRVVPINGLSAEWWLTQPGFDAGGIIFIVKDSSGLAVVVQSFMPGQSGFAPVTDEAEGGRYADRMAGDRTVAGVFHFLVDRFKG